MSGGTRLPLRPQEPSEVATIRALRAWRYDPAVVGRAERLMAPLDDDPALSRLHYRLSEHALHLAAPRSVAQAVDRLQRWRGQGVLRRDPLPAYYAYAQHYTAYGEAQPRVRRGVVGWLRLDDADDMPTLLPHEGTLDAAVAGLTELLAATGLNVTPVHALYDDPSHALEPLLDDYLRAPLLDTTDSAGVTHRMAMLQHRGQLRQVEQLLAGQTLILADGHHRLAAALQHKARLEAAHGPLPQRHPARYVLAYCSNTAGDRLSIYPFHRVLRLPRGLDAATLLARLEEHYTLEPLEARAPLHEVLSAAPHRMGLVLERRWHLLTLRPGADPQRLLAPLGLPASVNRLDYTLLHYLVFDRIAGIAYAAQRQSDALSYHRDSAGAIERALYRPGHAAFLMPEVAVADLRAVVHDRALMPPKSTYFAPKVLAGLLFGDLSDTLADTPYDAD